jgi:hypothetical protein
MLVSSCSSAENPIVPAGEDFLTQDGLHSCSWHKSLFYDCKSSTPMNLSDNNPYVSTGLELHKSSAGFLPSQLQEATSSLMTKYSKVDSSCLQKSFQLLSCGSLPLLATYINTSAVDV